MEIREYSAWQEDEILALYASVGWTAYTNDPAALRGGFENSLLILGAYEGEKLVGIIRVVGDGYTIVFIQDILILPEYQRKGIGAKLIRSVLERFPSVRQIELAADNTPGTAAFYQAQGFLEMSKVGCRAFLFVGEM